MRRRLLLPALLGAATLALVASGCGAEEPEPTPASTASVAPASKEGSCDCTGETRARDRIADGRATRHTGTVTLGG